MPIPIGGVAALAAAMIWSGTSTVFTRAGRATSPVAVNAFKTAVAGLVFTVAVARRLHGDDPHIGAADVVRLALSGVAGLTVGDSFLFRSFVDLGTRRATLVYSTYPIFGAAGGAIFLDERLSGRAIAGMALAIGGVAWAIAERPVADAPASARKRGVLGGLGAALGSAAGALIAKPALSHVDTLTATWIRMSAGGLMLVAIGIAAGWFRAWVRGLGRRELLPGLFVATLFGPCIGVWCMFFALAHMETGVALTLLSTTPIWLLVVNVVWHRERVTLREIMGFVMALAGIAVLMSGLRES